MGDAKVSSLLIFGLFLFVLPTILNIFGVHLWGIVSRIGIFFLVIGIIHSAWLTIKS